MKKIYFFKIPESFNIFSYPKIISMFTEERLEKTPLMPQIKHTASILGEAVVKIIAYTKFKCDGGQINIERDDNGKPYLKDFPDFYFNISHSENAVAIAFSETPVGIDIEKLGAPNFKVAERFFTKSEKEYIKNSNNPDFSFYEIWTAKEAYFKRNGKGIGPDFFKISVKDKDTGKIITTFKKNEFIVSLCAESPKSFEIIDLDEDFFKLCKYNNVNH